VSDLHWLTATAAAEAIRARRLSPVELTKALLDRCDHLDPRLHVFIRLDGDAAMDAAKGAEAEISAGRPRGPLHGVPIGIKDIIDVAGLPTTCHSKILADNVASAIMKDGSTISAIAVNGMLSASFKKITRSQLRS